MFSLLQISKLEEICTLVQSEPVKTQPNSHALLYKAEIRSRSTPVTLKSKSPWLPGHCSLDLRKSCTGANMIYLRTERVFILEHYFASKSFTSVREAFRNAYPDKEVSNKTTVHRLGTKFRGTGSVCLWQVRIDRQNSWNYDRTNFKQCISCNKGIWLQEFNIAIGFVVLCVKMFMCSS
jgi:hypothetical protein